MSGLLPARVSQEAFDEVVKENMEDFEMSPEEATKDAITQFRSQGVSLDNLDLSVPTDEARALRSKYLGDCKILDECVSTDGDIDLEKVTPSAEEITECLDTITKFCTPSFENSKIFRSLLVTGAGIYTLMSFLGVSGEGSKPVLIATVKALRCVTKESTELKDAFIAQALCNKLIDKYAQDAEVVGHLLALLKTTCKGAESNKGYFMKANGAKVLIKAIQNHPTNCIVIGEFW